MGKPADNHTETAQCPEDADRVEAILLRVSTLAHDTNNLLVAMMNSASILSKHRSVEVAEQAIVVLSGCNRLAAMVRRLQAHCGHPHSAQPNAVLTALLPTLRSLAGPGIRV